MPERGPTQVSCTCGAKYTDLNENEAYARFQQHVIEKAEQDDLLHFRKDVEVVSGKGDEALSPAERLHAMSNDIARQLHRRNFGKDWTTREEADLMRDMLFFVVDQTHHAYHQEVLGETTRWQDCRRITCTYLSVGLGERKDDTSSD